MTQENLAENVIQIYRQYGRQWMDLRGTYLYKRVYEMFGKMLYDACLASDEYQRLWHQYVLRL